MAWPNYDSTPGTLTIEVELTPGTFTPINDSAAQSDIMSERSEITMQRPKPGDPGRMQVKAYKIAGGINLHEEQILRAYDDSDPANPYPRYWWGPIKEITYSVSGDAANEEVYDIVAYGPDQLFKEPPYQLSTPYTVGYQLWQANRTYSVGDVIQPNPTNGHRYSCTRAGTSGHTQPTFATGAGSNTQEPATWQPNYQYIAGDIVKPATTNGHRYECTVSGTSGATHPTWPVTYYTAVGESGLISVSMTSGGSGYGAPPTVGFSGGGGSGATATATIVGGVVVAVVITNSGSGYTSAPGVTFTPTSGGSGAAAVAYVSSGLTWREHGADDNAPLSIRPGHAYSLGDIVSDGIGYDFICTTAGTTGSGLPNWNRTGGGTTQDGTVVWTFRGTDPNFPIWHEAGSAYVTDRTVLLDLLPRYFGTYVTYGGVNTLIASVPYMVLDAGTTVEEALQKIAASAQSATYNVTYPHWSASLSYTAGTVIEPTVVNGHTYLSTNSGTSGLTEPVWPTTSGATVSDGTMVWKENGLIGRYIHNFNYRQGQIVQPDAQPAYYYTSIDNGTSANTDPAWPTTIGTIVADGTTAWVCTGQTSVLPRWQFSIPNDNSAHTASWTPDFSWFDVNNSVQVPTLTPPYTDDQVFDGSMIHWDTMNLNRVSTETCNTVYVLGNNGSFAMKQDAARLANDNNRPRSLVIKDTSLTTNGQCSARAGNVLASLRTRETVQATAKQLPDPIAMRGLRKVSFQHDLLIPSATVYPLTDISMAMPDGIAEYTINAGDSFVNTTDDVLQATLGGRAFTGDLVPPALVTFPADWVLENTVDVHDHTVRFTGSWRDGGEGDLSHFLTRYLLGGDPFYHNGPRVEYPSDQVTIAGLPQSTDFRLSVLAVDTSGNPQNPTDADWALSPIIQTATEPPPPSPPTIPTVTSHHDASGYHLSVTVDKANAGDDGSGGGMLQVRVGIVLYVIYPWAPNTPYPLTIDIADGVPGTTYYMSADIIDRYGQHSGFCTEVPYTLVSDAPPAPIITAVSSGPEANNMWYADVTVAKSNPGDDASGGGEVYCIVQGGPVVEVAIPPNRTFPYVARVHGLHLGDQCQFYAYIMDQFFDQSPVSGVYPSVGYYTITSSPPPAPSITSPISFQHTIHGYVANPVINSGGGDTTGGGFIMWSATTDGSPAAIEHVEEIPPGSTFPYTGFDHIDENVTYQFTAAVFDRFGQASNMSSPVTVRVGSPAPRKVLPPSGWQDSGPDQVLAGWLPVSPAVNADFAIVADSTGNDDSTALKMVNVPNAGGTKTLQSYGFSAKAGRTYYFKWAAKTDGGTVLGKMFVQPQSWTGNPTDAYVNVGSPIQVGVNHSLGTSYPSTWYEGTVTLPAGATQFAMQIVGVNNNLSGVTQNIFFAYPQYTEQTPASGIYAGAVDFTQLSSGVVGSIPGGNTGSGLILQNTDLEVTNVNKIMPPDHALADQGGGVVKLLAHTGKHYTVPIISSASWSNSALESGALFTGIINPNELIQGEQIVARIFGTLNNSITGHTTTLRVKIAGTTIFTVAMPTMTTAKPWMVEFVFTVRSLGSPGSMWAYLLAHVNNALADQTNTTLAAINTTLQCNVTVTAQFSVASASDVLTIDQGLMYAWD